MHIFLFMFFVVCDFHVQPSITVHLCSLREVSVSLFSILGRYYWSKIEQPLKMLHSKRFPSLGTAFPVSSLSSPKASFISTTAEIVSLLPPPPPSFFFSKCHNPSLFPEIIFLLHVGKYGYNCLRLVQIAMKTSTVTFWGREESCPIGKYESVTRQYSWALKKFPCVYFPLIHN